MFAVIHGFGMSNPVSRKAMFADLLRCDHARLYGYIHSLVRDLNDADDLFQQTTLVLWNKFETFDAERSFFNWACGVARGEVANFLRARGRQKLYFSDELNLLLVEAHEAMSIDELEDRREALAKCMEKLRDRDRELLTQCYGGDDAIQDIAGRHGRSSSSVHNSLRRIRRALFDCIQQTLSAEPTG